MGPEDMAKKSVSGTFRPLFVHFLAHLQHAKRFYAVLATFPDVDNENCMAKIRWLAINAENMGVIFLGRWMISTSGANRAAPLSWNTVSLAIQRLTRPKGMPIPVAGANVVLPETQPCCKSGKISSKLQRNLQNFFDQTGQVFLPEFNNEHVLKEHPYLEICKTFTRNTVENVYRRILKDEGKLYQSWLTRAMIYPLVMSCALIRFCESAEPHLSSLCPNGRYAIHDKGRLDWNSMSFLALDLAPEGLDPSKLSPSALEKHWKTRVSQTQRTADAVFQKNNWEVLRSKSMILQL